MLNPKDYFIEDDLKDLREVIDGLKWEIEEATDEELHNKLVSQKISLCRIEVAIKELLEANND